MSPEQLQESLQSHHDDVLVVGAVAVAPWYKLSQRWQLAAFLLAINCVTHFAWLSYPKVVIFDEFYFGKFASQYCCKHENFFDIHPPHAKLLIAGFARTLGYDGNFDFAKVGKSYGETNIAALRFGPALIGTLIAPVFFLLLLQLGATPAAAFLGGLVITFENGLLLQGRIVVLDAILVFFELFSLLLLLMAIKVRNRLKSSLLLLCAGGAAGFALGSKYTGLIACGMAVMVIIHRLFARRKPLVLALITARRILWFFSGVTFVYLAGWFLHFKLLTLPGPGDAFYVAKGNFFLDFVMLQKKMLLTNMNLTASHNYYSEWWSWPFMKRGVYYAQLEQGFVYFLGNPFIWFPATLMLVVFCMNFLLMRVTKLKVDGAARRTYLWLAILGFFMAYLPYIPVARGLFLYHYLPPLTFAILAAVLGLDYYGFTTKGSIKSQRVAYFTVIAVVVTGFLVMLPLTQGLPFPKYANAILKTIKAWR
jgi:dolichyl-phosphate-mannose--protein O-mannosyl transferase